MTDAGAAIRALWGHLERRGNATATVLGRMVDGAEPDQRDQVVGAILAGIPRQLDELASLARATERLLSNLAAANSPDAPNTRVLEGSEKPGPDKGPGGRHLHAGDIVEALRPPLPPETRPSLADLFGGAAPPKGTPDAD